MDIISIIKKYKSNYQKAKTIIQYYDSLKQLTDEDYKYLKFIKRNKYTLSNNKLVYLSSTLASRYSHKKVDVNIHPENKFPYVLHKGKKLFYPQSSPRNNIINSYRALLLEQDVSSPHLYWSNEDIYNGKVLFDIGAAEGIVSLTYIEKLKHVYLFECEQAWIDALQLTFAPYREKVTIVKGIISAVSDKSIGSISIDDFVRETGCAVDLIKMDIEGYEEDALAGAFETFKSNNIAASICTYHKADAEKNIKGILDSIGYKHQMGNGCMCIVDSEPPYFRQSIIRAYK